MRLAVTLPLYVNIPINQFRLTFSQSTVINSFRAEIIIKCTSYTPLCGRYSPQDTFYTVGLLITAWILLILAAEYSLKMLSITHIVVKTNSMSEWVAVLFVLMRLRVRFSTHKFAVMRCICDLPQSFHISDSVIPYSRLRQFPSTFVWFHSLTHLTVHNLFAKYTNGTKRSIVRVEYPPATLFCSILFFGVF
jgi:hypothetical protein